MATRAQYESLFGRLLKLPDETLVYPAHDYKGDTVSTIGEERIHNPRLQVRSAEEYIELMNNLRLGNPKMMDVALPANLRQGLPQEQIAQRGWAYSAEQAKALIGGREVVLVDLREKCERERHGEIPGALHLPYGDLRENLSPNDILHMLAAVPDRTLLFYCAFGERSAMAVQVAQDAGLRAVRHIQGGIEAWRKAGGALA
jgi:rhodanese-related sulfurtransferase